MKVRFHPIIGLKHDGKIYTYGGKGIHKGEVFLEEKEGVVMMAALSVPKTGFQR